ncbi:MAG TPA: flagellar hook-basal body protein [Tepidiformaceae bacterium]|nr:flagellar hook-basal body protein [Tepidiformaceae bacterium]
MIKGLYSAFTAMEAAWRYQDVLANNIANANTVGYRREFASQHPFADVLLSQQAAIPAPITARIQQVVGQIGTGKFIAEFATDFQGGIIRQTGNELDFALTNGFFAVETETGEVFHTRDGRFGRDAAGDLVTSLGHYVLGANGEHINLPEEFVTVNGEGAILDGEGNELGRILVQDFTPLQLERAGEAYFRAAPGAGAPPLGGPGLRQGFIEGSNSNLVEEMTSLLTVQRTYQANQAVLAKLDGTLEQAAGELGRF